MADTVNSLAARVHELLVAHLTDSAAAAAPPRQDFLSSLASGLFGVPLRVDVAAGLQDVITRAAALGPAGTWLVAAGHSGLAGLALTRGQAEPFLYHLDAAVTAGYNDCVALHAGPVLPLHHDPRFRALYQRIRLTEADLDEFFWLHREIRNAVRDAQDATVDNIDRLDTGVSLLPQAPMPTREPDTPGVLITRIDLAATQTALQQAAVKAEFGRSSGNTALGLIDDTWDHSHARRDARHADDRDTRLRRAAEARAFAERPGAGAVVLAAPPLGSFSYPA
ncbi:MULTISPECIES: hypothetical protein [Streptomyces]|uniref:hypothetical protein n=1 Tax=Streptomyces TaxID=1883 RepID=UPI000F7A6B7C|nr:MULTISPECIES: hypothetical protein [Streptomyces]RST04537.1 hypothetical protein EF910_16095 [Streptomyces sp. WAC07149]GLX21498.1 hypothetical protein Slala01_51420 [Streptomyces lavendulae subsp. lavendulae]GLX28915.1 hypothetical protein Slala02_47350 [Streptomyces lavendulae subsp. lavendulae]